PPIACTASRWATTASRRSCREGSHRSVATTRSRARPDARRRAAIVAAPVARDWSDLLVTGAPGDAAADQARADPERRRGLLRRLRESMAKTRSALGSELHATLFGTLDEHTWER